MNDKPEPIIAAAAGTSTAGKVDASHGRRVEQAMVDAVNECHAKGITDAAEILKAKLAARDAVLATPDETVRTAAEGVEHRPE